MMDQDGSQHSGAQSVDVKLKGGNIDDWEVTEKTPVADVAQRYGPDANRANKQKLGNQYGLPLMNSPVAGFEKLKRHNVQLK